MIHQLTLKWWVKLQTHMRHRASTPQRMTLLLILFTRHSRQRRSLTRINLSLLKKKLLRLERKKVSWIPRCRLAPKHSQVTSHARLSACSLIIQGRVSPHLKAITIMIVRIKRMILSSLKTSKFNATWNKSKANWMIDECAHRQIFMWKTNL